MKLKSLMEEVNFNNETIVLNKLIMETIKKIVEEEYDISLNEQVSACANLVKGQDDITLSNALLKLSQEADTGALGKYGLLLQQAGTSLTGCIENIKSVLGGGAECDVTVDNPQIKKEFSELVISKIKDQSFDKEMMGILNGWKLNKLKNVQDAINLIASKVGSFLTV